MPTLPVPAPVTVENLWRLDVDPRRIEEAARVRRTTGVSYTVANDQMVGARNKLSWSGPAATLADVRHREVTVRLDRMAATSARIANVLDEVAAVQRSSQQYLLDSLNQIAAARVQITVGGDSITFQPADAQGAAIGSGAFRSRPARGRCHSCALL